MRLPSFCKSYIMFAEDYIKINPSKVFIRFYVIIKLLRLIFCQISISRLLYSNGKKHYNIFNVLCTNYALKDTETFRLEKLCAMKDELICM